jgi:PIN domain nuclease of toxin-antitoxin system
MSRYLLDTMTILWMALRPDLLGKSASCHLVDEGNELSWSVVSLWEIGIKMGGKGYREFELPNDWEVVVPQRMIEQGMAAIEILPVHCRLIQDLPFHHKDPFDRMLVAQALTEDLTIISSDSLLDSYGVRRVW